MSSIKLLFLITLIVAVYAAACLFKPKPSDYAAQTPVFNPDIFFNGPLQSWGVIRNFYTGKEVQQFKMQAVAKWQGNSGTMEESFVFDDGKTKERHWTFTKTDDHHFIGTAPDVEGEARGEVYGNALHWVYDIYIPVQGKQVSVHFNDWLYLVDEKHMFSMVRISKWGIPIGTLTMFFSKN